VQLQSVTIKNFRCFENLTMMFEQPVILIEGSNGSGKTSLLEALHYACYLRSFRTTQAQELVREGSRSFFIKAMISDDTTHEVQVGFSERKKLVRLDQRAITTYKELFDTYRVVTVTEDDLSLIRGAPEERRAFIDQICTMANSEYGQLYRSFRQIWASRNAVLRAPFHKESYALWSEQLYKSSELLRAQREAVLQQLEKKMEEIITTHLGSRYTIQLHYKAVVDYGQSYEAFQETLQKLTPDEIRYGRSLFGAHLDDITILFADRRSRSYASRGQQKLIVLIMKMAQQTLFPSSLMLLDDFMTDFDQIRLQELIPALLASKNQLIFTVPVSHTPLADILVKAGAQVILLDA